MMMTKDRIHLAIEPLEVLYTAEQASRRLQCSQATIRSYWQRGLLEKIKCGHMNRCSEAGIREFLARSKQRAESRKSTNWRLGVAGLRKARELRKQSKQIQAKEKQG
jgi:hypothetical protein